MGVSPQQPHHAREPNPVLRAMGTFWKWFVRIAATLSLILIVVYGLLLLFGIIGIGTSSM